MKNHKLKSNSKSASQLQRPVKYVEDLFQQDEIDVCAVLNAKYKNPIQTWCISKLFDIEIELKERKQQVKFFFKKLFKNDK